MFSVLSESKALDSDLGQKFNTKKMALQSERYVSLQCWRIFGKRTINIFFAKWMAAILDFFKQSKGDSARDRELQC